MTMSGLKSGGSSGWCLPKSRIIRVCSENVAEGEDQKKPCLGLVCVCGGVEPRDQELQKEVVGRGEQDREDGVSSDRRGPLGTGLGVFNCRIGFKRDRKKQTFHLSMTFF